MKLRNKQKRILKAPPIQLHKLRVTQESQKIQTKKFKNENKINQNDDDYQSNYSENSHKILKRGKDRVQLKLIQQKEYNRNNTNKKEDEIKSQQEKSIEIDNTSELQFDNDYDKACHYLQLSSIPKFLPCRDNEREIIKQYIQQGIQNKGSSSSLYISGMPGTGKTATTLEIITSIINNQKQKYKDFDFIHINAMSLTNPNTVYTILAEKILEQRHNPQTAQLFLDEFFKQKEKKQTVLKYICKNGSKGNQYLLDHAEQISRKLRLLLIDELDALITTKQQLLYNLFEWPCHQNSQLLVISIANTMNLPERLQNKIQSRIGNNRLVYEPYTKEQIEIILQSRLKDINVFQQESIAFVSQKVSQYSGDIRRSLQITKRAVEICRDEYNKQMENERVKRSNKKNQKELKKVSIDHLNQAFDELSNSNTVMVMRSLRKFEILILIALFLLCKSQNAEKVELGDLQDKCESILLDLQDYHKRQFNKTNYQKISLFQEQQLDLDEENISQIKYNWDKCYLTTSSFKEIIKRLQQFGLVNIIIDGSKLSHNEFASHHQFFDFCDLRSAYSNNQIYLSQQKHFKSINFNN